MTRSKRSLVPLRGSTEDWGPGKYQRNLERKEAYSQKMLEQIRQGPPDFEKLVTQGAVPAPPKAPAKKKATKTTKGKVKTAKKKRRG